MFNGPPGTLPDLTVAEDKEKKFKPQGFIKGLKEQFGQNGLYVDGILGFIAQSYHPQIKLLLSKDHRKKCSKGQVMKQGGLHLIGPSQIGKSTLLEAVAVVYPHEEDGEKEGSGHSVTSFAAMLQELEKGGPPLIADPPTLH